ncbi:MAG: ImmA/IrrE family metallo-endopeptidase [Gammaproteobacteria bacterium]|nr:ImmA/IrrE family metallo-endopeptidase [Gammaproteobacteria bacterium]
MTKINTHQLSAPEKLLWKLGITAPNEIDLEAIAYHLGAIVRYRTLDGGDARIVGDGSRAIITINASTPKPRQRFSIGHEVAHWCCDRGRGGFLCSKEDTSPQNCAAKSIEANANAFASMILLPDYLFKPRTAKQPITLDTASKLAQGFQASLTATAIKLVRASTSPAIVICHSQTKCEWFITNSAFPHEFWPQDELHQDTDAFELIFGSGNGMTRAKNTSGALWFNRRDANQFQMLSQSTKLPDGTVLSTISL